MTTYDVLSLLPTLTLPCLDDGSVTLVDCMPRLVPKGRTAEYRIVECARISTGGHLKTPEEDAKLLRFLWTNEHMSPFESVELTFRVRCPRFVAVHFLRHRTAKFNEFSQRYADSPSQESFYHPSKMTPDLVKGGWLRLQSTANKQGSDSKTVPSVEAETIHKAFLDAEAAVEQVKQCYEKLRELGVARELARFCLPNAEYTELYISMNLRNFLHMYQLRADEAHAQPETVVFAKAMGQLVRPLCPVTFAIFESTTLQSLHFSKEEIDRLYLLNSLGPHHETNQTDPLLKTAAFKRKLGLLGMKA